MDNTKTRKFSGTLDSWLANLSKTGRSRKQAFSVAVDSSIVVFSIWAAYSLRLGMPFSDFKSTWHFFLVLPIVTVVIFMSLGIYRWVVRSSNSSLFKQLIKAVLASALFFVIFSVLFPGFRGTPRSLFVIYALLLGAGSCGVRFLWQGIFDSGRSGEPVAIYGAGDAGRQLLHALAQGQEYRPVLFLDDNSFLSGSTIAGVPVATAGSTEMHNILAGLEVERVILAMPRIGPHEYQQKIDLFKSSGLTVLTVPTHVELVSGSAKLAQVRELSITDILGRTEVPPNPQLLGACVTGKNVLVTGGGGSIGSELCRQIILQKPEKLIVFDHSEFNLYQITEELTGTLADADNGQAIFLPVLGNINNYDQISDLIARENVHTVYHAAAYKHVPVIEAQPGQGVETNIFGTIKVADASIAAGVEKFILISTDKAVRPTNSMGATKRIAELALQAKAKMQTETKISMVRFGNVLGSSGSVVPKFKRQIESGGPITLTHPDVTRFFMTIPEAAQLVMQASSISVGGDVFVLDMGEPIRIEELAISMVKFSGKRLKRDTGREDDIEIIVEGLRPGEKMYEELFLTDEHMPTSVSKVFTAKEAFMEWSRLRVQLDSLVELTENPDKQLLRDKLLELAFLSKKSTTAMPRDAVHEQAHNEAAVLS